MTSNQTTLGNGCVCDSGCPDCDRLAEAFEAMREALSQIVPSEYGCKFSSNGHVFITDDKCGPCADVEAARAALALADKVSRL